MNQRSFLRILVLIPSLVLISCDKESIPEKKPTPQSLSETTYTPDYSSRLLKGFLLSAQDAMAQLIVSSDAFKKSISQFIQDPSEDRLSSAKNSWEDTHNQYLAMKVFWRINLVHPQLDLSQTSPKVIHPIHIRLDQQPIIPGYLDAVENYRSSGLVYSELALSNESLNNEHQFSDIGYVAMGFHALKFMLEGDPAFDQKPLARFSKISEKEEDAIAPLSIKMRRSKYVKLLANLIVEDLIILAREWSSNNGFYVQTLTEMEPEKSERLILRTLDLENKELSILNSTIKPSESNKDQEPHQNKKAIEARIAQLLSTTRQIKNSAYSLPKNLQEIIEQEEPEQTEP